MPETAHGQRKHNWQQNVRLVHIALISPLARSSFVDKPLGIPRHLPSSQTSLDGFQAERDTWPGLAGTISRHLLCKGQFHLYTLRFLKRLRTTLVFVCLSFRFLSPSNNKRNFYSIFPPHIQGYQSKWGAEYKCTTHSAELGFVNKKKF